MLRSILSFCLTHLGCYPHPKSSTRNFQTHFHYLKLLLECSSNRDKSCARNFRKACQTFNIHCREQAQHNCRNFGRDHCILTHQLNLSTLQGLTSSTTICSQSPWFYVLDYTIKFLRRYVPQQYPSSGWRTPSHKPTPPHLQNPRARIIGRAANTFIEA
jgi:hypothetical protein